MKEPTVQMLWAVQERLRWAVETRLREIERLASVPEDRRGEIIRETNGALADLRDASSQLREARRALFDPEVSP